MVLENGILRKARPIVNLTEEQRKILRLPRRKMKHQEYILVVPKANVPKAHTTNILVKGIDLTVLIENAVYMQRAIAETNEDFVQLIPYVVVKSGGKYLSYQRSSGSGEDRLHGNYSIGIGGHLDFFDNETQVSCVYNGMLREVKEELGLSSTLDMYSPVGTLYDDSNEVGRVHLGLVYTINIKDLDLSQGELDILLNRELIDIEMLGDTTKYEEWSRATIVALRETSSNVTEVLPRDTKAELEDMRQDLLNESYGQS